MNKKVLVAIDGSVFSLNSIDYLIRLFSEDHTFSIHLFAVVSEAGTGQNWMYEVDPHREHAPLTERRRITAEKYLRDAKARLVRNGFSEKRVTFEAQITGTPSSTAIHHEACQGTYDALVVGRRGMGKVGELFFGSVSSFIVEKCHEIPLWLIDGEISSNRFLLAVHCKPESLLAADHLGFMIRSNPDAQIFLYHSKILFGKDKLAAPEDFHETWGKEWCDQYLDPENYLFYAHAQVLKDHGIESKRITQLPMGRNLYVSRDLLKRTEKNKCGTIIMGRRPRTEVKSMFGGVSDQTLQQAENLALWLVG